MNDTVQSCVDFYTKTVLNITQMIEDRLSKRFALSEGSEKAHSDMKILDLADHIARELNIKQIEVIPLINIYLKNSTVLETKNGKTITKIGDAAPKTLMSVEECAARHYDLVKGAAPEIIALKFEQSDLAARQTGTRDEELFNKVKLKFQNLCDDIADTLHIKTYVVYHNLKKYINTERKDLAVGLGRGGGLYRIKAS